MKSSDVFINFFSSPSAIGLYLALLLLLVCVLVAYVLIALHLVRKHTDQASKQSAEDETKQTNAEEKDKEKTGTSSDGSRFSQLARIDQELAAQPTAVFSTYPLSEICSRFRDYAASKLGLYYSIEDIRRFIGGMGISKLIILKGMSGTGKTSLAYAAGEFFDNPSTIVPIQPMWKERSDMIGYFNEFTKKFSETTMLTKLYEAGGKKEVYITVLDEVNISRIEYYFAEFLSLLEIPDPKRRYVDVVSDSWKTDPQRLNNGKLLLPENMWFVGTANNDDSTFAISDKVYDRAAVMDLERKCTPFDAPRTEACHISYAELERLFREAQTKHTLSTDTRDRLAKLDEYLKEVFRISFGNRIMKQIEAYIPIMLECGGSEGEALDDILSRKILRKLEQLSPAFVKAETPALISKLDELFGADSLQQSREYIQRLKKTM